MPPIKLKYPIKSESDKDIKQVEVAGVLRVKHLHLLPASIMQAQVDGVEMKKGDISMADMLPLVAALCGLTTKEADELALEDFQVIVGVVLRNFSNAPESQATGSK